MEMFTESTAMKERFRLSANRLLNNCFLLKHKDETRDDYYFVTQHQIHFIEYFDLLGYTLIFNENQGVVALTSGNSTGRLRFKLIETMGLLIIRLLYLEKREELCLSDEVVITVDDIHTKYNMLEIKGKPSIDKTTFRELIKLFKNYNLLTNMDSDLSLSDTRIKVYASILFGIPSDNIKQIHTQVSEKLGTYTKRGKVDEIDDDIDDEEIM